LGSGARRHPWPHSHRGAYSCFDGSVLIEVGERFDASQEGFLPEDDQFKHQDRDEGRQAAEAGRGYRSEEGRQEQKVNAIEVIQPKATGAEADAAWSATNARSEGLFMAEALGEAGD
jgi:hypothetical protein